MIRRIRGLSVIIAVVIVIGLLMPVMALASDITNALFYGTILVSNNSTAETNVATTGNLSTPNFISGGFLSGSANECVVRNTSGADINFMPGYSTNDWCFFVPSIGADSYFNYILYTANSSGGDINYFPAAAGMYSSDNATIEPGNGYSINQTGFFDVLSSANRSTIYKPQAFETYYPADGTVRSTVLSPNWINPTGFTDPSGNWANEPNAYDDDTATRASQLGVLAASWSDWLELNIASTEICSIRHWSNNWAGVVEQVDIDLYYNGGWNDLYQGAFSNLAYDIIYLDETAIRLNVTSARFRYYVGAGGPANVELYEFDFGGDTEDVYVEGATTSAEQSIITTSGTAPGVTEYATGATVGVSMGVGMLPVLIIDEQELTAPAASVTFSSINVSVAAWEALTSETYRHLVVMVNAKSPDAVANRNIRFRFNGDSGANYNSQDIVGAGAGASATRYSATTSLVAPFYIPGTTYANAFGGGVLLIPFFNNTTNHKATLAFGGAVEDAVDAQAGRWASAAAITSVEIYANTGNLDTGSTFQLGVVDEAYLVEEEYNAGADFLPDFNGIAGTGHDLCIIGYARTDRAGTSDDVFTTFNGDGGAANYFVQNLNGSGAATNAATWNNKFTGRVTGDNATANAFGVFFETISQYAEGTNDPHLTGVSGFHEASGPDTNVRLVSYRRNNIAAVARVQYAPVAGTNFKAGSLFSLYRVPRYTIDRQELTAPAATITFTDIPQGYEAWQLNVYARSSLAAINENVEITLNTDAVAANYDFQSLDGAGVVVTAARNAASQVIMAVPAANEAANEFGGGIVTIKQPNTTTGHKHFVTISGTQENQVIIRSSRWESTAAITRIDLDLAGANNFVAGSIFELVGLMPTDNILQIEVDGDLLHSEDANNYPVPDNAANWYSGLNNAMPYVEALAIDISGVATANWVWEYGSTFTDSISGIVAYPSFRTSSSDTDIIATMTSFQPVEEAQAPAYSLADEPDFFDTMPPIVGDFDVGSGTGTFPLAAVITSIANATATPTPEQLPLLTIAIFILLTVSLGISYVMRRYGSNTVFIKWVFLACLMGVFIAFGNFAFNFYMLVVFCIIAVAISFASKQREL